MRFNHSFCWCNAELNMFLSTLTTSQEAFRREVGKITLRISRVEYQFFCCLFSFNLHEVWVEWGVTCQKSRGILRGGASWGSQAWGLGIGQGISQGWWGKEENVGNCSIERYAKERPWRYRNGAGEGSRLGDRKLNIGCECEGTPKSEGTKWCGRINRLVKANLAREVVGAQRAVGVLLYHKPHVWHRIWNLLMYLWGSGLWTLRGRSAFSRLRSLKRNISDGNHTAVLPPCLTQGWADPVLKAASTAATTAMPRTGPVWLGAGVGQTTAAPAHGSTLQGDTDVLVNGAGDTSSPRSVAEWSWTSCPWRRLPHKARCGWQLRGRA